MSNFWPSSGELTDALLKVLERLGGEGSVAILDFEVSKEVKLSETQMQIIRSGKRTEIQYRLAWIRTKAKQNGLVQKESNRVWSLTEKGRAFIKS
jgi:restriction system protein